MAVTAPTFSFPSAVFVFQSEENCDTEEDVVHDELALIFRNVLFTAVPHNTRTEENRTQSSDTSANMHTHTETSCNVERSSDTETITTIGSSTIPLIEDENKLNSNVATAFTIDKDIVESEAADKLFETQGQCAESDLTHTDVLETSVDRPKILANATEPVSMPQTSCSVPANLESFANSSSHKKRLSRRLRYERKEKKIRRIDPSEFGFHLSRIPRTPSPSHDEAKPEGEMNSAPVDNQQSNSIPNNTSSPAESDMPMPPVPDGDIMPQDDESFFTDLGIDIKDSGTFYANDDFLDWDAFRLSSSRADTKAPNSQKASSPAMCHVNSRVSLTNSSKEHFDRTKYKLSTQERIIFSQLECTCPRGVFLRKDKQQKVQKLHRSVKSGHLDIKSIRNNEGRKKVFIYHRLNKRFREAIELGDPEFAHRRCHLPAMPKHGVDLEVARRIRIKPVQPKRQRHTQAQNLNHVLHETNAPSDLEVDLASFLVSIQNRELTPEDYEMLLRLDDTVAAKTVSGNVLDSLKTETVGPEVANVLMCVICMEPYLEGEVRKFLPCKHDFHTGCIDSWLANSSQNCPMDNLPIVDS